jgi:hypothetical protein
MNNLVKVESTAIKGVGYMNKVMTIQFHSQADNRAYVYYGVPKDVFNKFTSCESVGRYYSQEVRGQYDSEEIELYNTIVTVL